MNHSAWTAVAVAALLCACAGPEALDIAGDTRMAIRNGTEPGALASSVFMTTRPGSIGTGWIARYPGCVVTADHNEPTMVMDGLGNAQPIAGFMRRPAPGVASTAFDDLRVLRPARFEGAGTLDLGGSAPLPFGPGTAWSDAAPVWAEDGSFPLDAYAAAIDLQVVGYGMSDDTLASASTLRGGSFSGIGHRAGAATGGLWALSSDVGFGLCYGDSGAPVFAPDGTVIAVVRGSSNPGCAPAEVDEDGSYVMGGDSGIATSLSEVGGEDSVWAWLDRAIELTCGRGLYSDIAGEGAVTGTRAGPALRLGAEDDEPINGAIACRSDLTEADCVEMVHTGEQVTLTASPAEGWEFEAWSGGPSTCPCDGSEEPTCVVELDDMGTASATESIDSSVCVAEFVCTKDEDMDGVPSCEDCDDHDDQRGEGLPEVCDGIDNDCNGLIDEVGDEERYRDEDGDLVGAGTAELRCAAPGWVPSGGDCDDANAEVYPGAPEQCNGEDDDCDGEIDPDGSEGSTVWYADSDGDGYGADWSMAIACAAPDGHVGADGDCDDTSATTHEGANEICDGYDNDCDGVFDEDAGCGPAYPVDDPYSYDETEDADDDEAEEAYDTYETYDSAPYEPYEPY